MVFTTYSSKIKAFRVIAEYLNFGEEVIKLNQLRKQSDIMELVGHPKNPRLLKVKDPAKTLFLTFSSQLHEVELALLDEVQSRSNLGTARKVAEICLSDQSDEAKLAELSSCLETNVQKTESGFKLGF
ncbi:hypothetical protein ELY21_09795 [Legionella sp. km535]|uniref:hypothetical protein n=1 Tax=Legionella sp. km535 TaxID=2498107 RepID=UPI000F8E46F6|nr:hypothetical protein [Legionella sp. km535]RUR18022.1 hypothetical protein ELY21_09795 [Legionella sp. km535]